MHLLKPPNLPQLPLASWAPLRAALEESLVDRGGILNFSHDFLRKAVEAAFLQDPAKKDDCRIALAGYFEAQPSTERSCDELPWLLCQAEMFERLRNCLLDIDRFLSIHGRDEDELRIYWVNMNEERSMGESYINSFNAWSEKKGMSHQLTAFAANQLGMFLFNASLHAEAEQLIKKALKIDEQSFGKDHPRIATILNNLGSLLKNIDRLAETEQLMKRSVETLIIFTRTTGQQHPHLKISVKNYTKLLQTIGRSKVQIDTQLKKMGLELF